MKTAEPLRFKIIDIAIGLLLGVAYIPLFVAEKINAIMENMAERYLDYRRSLKP